MYTKVKRLFDVLFSILFLLILSPLLVLITIIIMINDGRPVLFRQERVGKDWKTFRIIKFRTMMNNNSSSHPGITINNDGRITRTGRILRKYKLDELPQLINVVKGDMSLIGPRPELFKYVKHFREEYSEILKIRPGLSDYASIEFRNEAVLFASPADAESIYVNNILPQKLILNKRYLAERNFFTDLKIILMTVRCLYLTE